MKCELEKQILVLLRRSIYDEEKSQPKDYHSGNAEIQRGESAYSLCVESKGWSDFAWADSDT
jgi:hypothetical protein